MVRVSVQHSLEEPAPPGKAFLREIQDFSSGTGRISGPGGPTKAEARPPGKGAPWVLVSFLRCGIWVRPSPFLGPVSPLAAGGRTVSMSCPPPHPTPLHFEGSASRPIVAP